MRKKISFTSNNIKLQGLLETPAGNPRCYALFAHCFTCGKDSIAASRISRELVKRGIAVLRFDFTGLGSSDGDFSNTNFSSNLEDLQAACNFLREAYDAPAVLIGHSLGGAAVLAMAQEVPEAKAVVTIGAPFEANHVEHTFASSIDEIQEQGVAAVDLGGRKFNIRKQFIDDLKQQDPDHIKRLRKALLIMHSPVDAMVSIDEAEKTYSAAKHPKSFISLDTANHLLTKREDADYVAEALTGWIARYIPKAGTEKKSVTKGHIVVEERDHVFTQDVYSDGHHWLADEPTSIGGSDLGPDPYEHLLAGLGTCTNMTLRLYANRTSIPLKNVRVRLSHQRDYVKDAETCDGGEVQIEKITRAIEVEGELSVEQKKKLLKIANKCPVHRSLENKMLVETALSM
ncbi:MAG: OsmC family protein [Halioglobus sp.]|nr:OsmC family protein [Halioglobus sp.]